MAKKAQAPKSQWSHFRVMQDLPELGLKDGDTISHDPDDSVEPYILFRSLPVGADVIERAIAWGLLSDVSAGQETELSPAPRLGALQLVR